MTDIERLAAIEHLRQLKARYFRAVDSADSALMATVLADDCVLDYRGCCTDPATGVDHLPAMNVVIRRNGSEILAMDALARAGIVSVHQGHMFEVDFTGDDRATGIWSMTDRLYMPEGAAYALMVGYGHYHEDYVRTAAGWRIAAIRLTRIRVEVVARG